MNVARVSDARKMKDLIQSYLAVNGESAFRSLIPANLYYICVGSNYTDLDPGPGPNAACELSTDIEKAFANAGCAVVSNSSSHRMTGH